MSAAKDVKLHLFDVASRIVAPIVAAAASKIAVAIDPTVQDAQLRQLNLFAFEEMEVHYNALLLAYNDNTANEWPDPAATATAIASAPVTPSVTVPPAASIPSPGSNLSQIANVVAGVAGAVAHSGV